MLPLDAYKAEAGEAWTNRLDPSFRPDIAGRRRALGKVKPMKWNTPRTPAGPGALEWMPRIAEELSNIDGAQGGDAPFLDPFARSRRSASRRAA